MKTVIIAEAGVNHNGDLQQAKKLVEVAANAGADFVKFQTFKAERLVNKTTQKAQYQQENLQEEDTSQYQMLRKLELSEKDHLELIEHCKNCEIKFLSTAFDIESIDFLDALGIPLFKIPSGEITNKPYIKHIACKNKPVILSTGMSTLSDIKSALEVLYNNGIQKTNVTVLHCNTEYPTPFEDVNLLAMQHIMNEFGVAVGYSDHTIGIEVPIAAAALNASVIEKHFTLSRDLKGPDHKASLEPDELSAMVHAIRNIEKAVSGSGKKAPSPSEQKNMEVARRSIVALQPIKKGDTFGVENITVKRPGNGISPMKWDEVIGQKAKRNFNEDDLIEL